MKTKSILALVIFFQFMMLISFAGGILILSGEINLMNETSNTIVGAFCMGFGYLYLFIALLLLVMIAIISIEKK